MKFLRQASVSGDKLECLGFKRDVGVRVGEGLGTEAGNDGTVRCCRKAARTFSDVMGLAKKSDEPT
ncbi:MAG: hypothetical protein AAFQ89_13705, partial [Cyanobacteria bacterium J06626_18]